MEQLTDLRNALVHEYGEFTPQSTPDHVRRALPTLETYARVIGPALSPQPQEG